MTVRAVREFGKDSEGNPRTKEKNNSFKVDELVDTSKIVATLNNGVLTISAPADAKKTQESVRKIAVKPGSASVSDPARGEDNEDAATDDANEDHPN